MIRQCCVCGKTHQDGVWKPNVVLPEDEMVTHTYCPVCLQEHLSDMRGCTPPSPKLAASSA